MNPNLLNKTRAYCRRCGEIHGGEVIEQDGKIFGRLLCPEGEVDTLLSTDAGLFRKIRGRSFYGDRDFLGRRNETSPCSRKRFVAANFINLTNECDLKCPVCFASAGEGPIFFMEKEDFIARLKRLKKQNIRLLEFFGGEPSLHPEILEFTRIARYMGFKPVLISNGLRISDRTFLKSLKEAGLKAVHLQFDTFDQQLLTAMRGDITVEKKLQALENCISLGLELAVICTVVEANLKELPKILSFVQTLGPKMKYITFQGATTGGRFLLDKKYHGHITREDILHGLCAEPDTVSLSVDDFYPFPGCLPLGLAVHPDCMVFTALYKGRGSERSLPNMINMDKLYNRLQSLKKIPAAVPDRLFLGLTIFRHFKWIMLPHMVALGLGRFFSLSGKAETSRGRRHLIAILVESFASTAFQDREKTDFCPSIQTVDQGEVCACVYNNRREDHPLSRISVTKREAL